MADLQFDSSAAGKLYRTEVGTDRVEALFNEPEARSLISRLTLVEVQSVFASKVRTGEMTAEEFDRLRRRFLTDVSQRRFTVVNVSGRHYQEAERLIRIHGPTRSLRTLDALQLAVALDLRAQRTLDHFVCADHRLIAIAVAEGLPVINPEQP